MMQLDFFDTQEAQEMQWSDQQQRHAAVQAARQMGQGAAEADAAQHHRHQDHNAAWRGAGVNWDAADDDMGGGGAGDDHAGGGGAGDGSDIIIVNTLYAYSPNAVRRDEVVADFPAAMLPRCNNKLTLLLKANKPCSKRRSDN